MRKGLLILALALFAVLPTVWAYDFSATSPSGHTLYYEIISGTTNVGVVRPGTGSTYDNYVTGNVVIPATVTYGDTTYNVTELRSVNYYYGTYYGTFQSCSGLTSVTIPNSVTNIGEGAFGYCSGLTSVTIPNSVTSIGDGAFYDCSGLTSVTIPNSVTSIGYYAFYDCSGLTSVTIPNSVTSIRNDAFRGCSGLTSVTIGNSVTSIGNSAFRDCSGLTSVTIPNSVTSIGSSAFYNVRLIIYNGTATGSPWGAFLHGRFLEDGFVYADSTKTSLLVYIGSDTNVVIPNSVTSIGDSAFRGCSGLTSVTIGNSVTSIGPRAFSLCSGLTSVTIGNSVTSIGYDAFYNCSGLTSVTIPNSVTSIGYDAFEDCSSLTTLNFNAINCGDFSSNSYYHQFKNCPITTINIGDSVQRIPANFMLSGDYYLTYLTSVTIGNSVITIGPRAFYDCSGLTSVTIPNSVTSIGEEAFKYCSGLTSVTIPNSVTSIEYGTFSDCSGLTSVTIPNSVTSIGGGAFYECSGLTSVTIGNSVTSIGSSAFSRCTGLTSVTIGNSVTSIGESAFSLCSGLTSVTIGNSVTSIGGYAFYGCSGLTSVTIGNSVTSIGDDAFYNCSGLTSVTIPNSVTSIGQNAFYNCSSLTTLNFNAINCNYSNFYYLSDHPFYNSPITTINIGDSVQRIPAYFAYNLDSLNSITIPNSVTSIGDWAFEYCSGLTSVTIPNSVTSIGGGAFYECSGLTSVTIGNSVTSIGSSAFSRCTGLTSVTIGNSVTSIGESAFSLCSGLTSVTIGNSVTSIGESAFSGCNNLRDVTSLAVTPPTLGTTVFSVAGILKVPCGSLSAYRYSAWLDYFTIMEEICDNMTITVTSANESMGTVSGSGEYAFGTVATITATPNEGYRFVSWNDGNTDNPRTITVTGNATYIATFEEGEEVTRYTITVLSANESMGTVSGGGEYEVGTEITITATPNEGYHFVTWNDGNTDNPRTITVTEDATYIATFEEGVGIESRDMLSELAFYPNPTSGIITFNRNDIMKVEVLDAMGRTLEVYENAYTIDISKLAKGYYAMRITTAEGVAVRKVIRK